MVPDWSIISPLLKCMYFQQKLFTFELWEVLTNRRIQKGVCDAKVVTGRSNLCEQIRTYKVANNLRIILFHRTLTLITLLQRTYLTSRMTFETGLLTST